jgi:transposase
MSEPATFVGVDVSKAHLDVAARPGGAPFRLANDPAGVAALVERLRPLSPAPVVLEATGGFEAPALAALRAAGIPAAAINPRRARRFAEATGRLAKTDRIDAEALAHFAEAVRPEPRPAAEPECLALDAPLSRRGQLVAMRVMDRTTSSLPPAARGRRALGVMFPRAAVLLEHQ